MCFDSSVQNTLSVGVTEDMLQVVCGLFIPQDFLQGVSKDLILEL
jgi:hypothetical protein